MWCSISNMYTEMSFYHKYYWILFEIGLHKVTFAFENISVFF
jgi:hypothetical protein